MERKLDLDTKIITQDSPCYVIAEIGHNHQGDLEQCKKLFDSAKDAGANAVKLQKRDNRELFTKKMYDSTYAGENAYADTYGSHREFLEFNHDQYMDLKSYANEIGITFFSTAFDFSSLDFLEKINLPIYKVASGDINNVPLLKEIAKTGKPMIVSTGGAKMVDVERAYDEIMPINNKLCIMQCTSGYPPLFEELNLNVINTYLNKFQDIVIGFSAHDSGIAMGVAGYVLGARVIEKHFTLNRALKGTDHAFSLEPQGLKKLIRDLNRTHEALGNGIKDRYPSEEAPLYKMGKKIVASQKLVPGAVIKFEDLKFKSPNDGLPPWRYKEVIGRKIKSEIEEDQNIDMDNLV